ncbi:MAG: hypothetical protein KC443_06980, partial [Anaerolineales bacterium]|nr:hypothetical protein [Anaerolineales bacterium]
MKTDFVEFEMIRRGRFSVIFLMSKIRQQRTAEQIQLLLSELIQRDIQDPRLLGIT